MEIRWLRAFVAVADELHFARAAEALATATSNVSAQVRALEGHLQVRLLERGRRSTTRLTIAGEVFLPEARRILDDVERAESVGRAAGRGVLGRVRVGYVASAAYAGVLAQTVAHAGRDARIEVAIEEMSTPEQVEALLAERIDIGILRRRPDLPAALASTVLRTEDVLVALPEAQAARAGSAVWAHELRAARFAVPSFGEAHDAREEVTAVARAGGFGEPPVLAVRDYVSALALVGAGTAVALVPECVAGLPIPGVRCLPLRDAHLETSLLLVHRRAEAAPAVLTVLRPSGPPSDLEP